MDPSSVQEMSSETLEIMLVNQQKQQQKQEQQQQENKKPRPIDEHSQKCPRCESTNTKFCYYNNYSLSQPRYFCKSCRRYWTKGGTLRNVPVGGGCRKNNRRSSSSSKSSRSLVTTTTAPQLTTFSSYESGELSLTSSFQKHGSGNLGLLDDHDVPPPQQPPLMCNSNNTLGDILGIYGQGFVEAPNSGLYLGNNSLYYGGATGAFEEIHMSSGVVEHEICGNGSSDDRGVLWGFPWQVGGDQSNMFISDVDSSRQSCNVNGFGSSWQGLVNSPLM